MNKPLVKPENPCFSSGPCPKFKGFSIEMLKNAPFGRSHRSKLGKKKLALAIQKSRDILKLPSDYLIGIMPASDTGAFEAAMWSMLGQRGVDVFYWESFGKEWANDLEKQLKLQDLRIFKSDYGKLPDLKQADFSRDVVFAWNGTTSGVRVHNGDWIPANRGGLTFCDATSAVFSMDIPWDKIDVATYSWQKVLGSEGGHGMLILSPRAVQRLETYNPSWPLPKIFRLTKGGKIDTSIFEGSTINTPSMLANEDYLISLEWAEKIGGLEKLIAKSKENFFAFNKFVEKHDWIEFLADKEEYRSYTSVCFKLKLDDEKVTRMVKLLEEESVAYDCGSYRDAPPGLRFWCGATVEKTDIEKLLPWLEWAYEQVK
jgi:phosphoserine aminotransferase